MNTTKNPWIFIPSLYFIQGIPYCVVTMLSVILFKKMGISNIEIGFWTSLLNLPWIFKPLWGPLVDMYWRKRQWIWTMHLLMAVCLAAIAFCLQSPNFFPWSLVLFGVIAILSATHDIAADGFYILSLNSHQQALFVGVRSGFWRIAMVFCQGVLVMAAGFLEAYLSRDGAPVHGVVWSWTIVFGIVSLLMVLGSLWHRLMLPYPLKDRHEVGRPPFMKVLLWLSLTMAVPILAAKIYLMAIDKGIGTLFGHPAEEVASAGWGLGGLLIKGALLGILIWIVLSSSGLRQSLLKWFRGMAQRSGLDFAEVFIDFFRRPGIGWMIYFLVIYRLGEAQLVKMSTPFLLDGRELGGLALTTQQVGIAYGVIGVVALLAGGIAGGYLVTKGGLKRWLPLMWCCLNIPDLVYVYMAYYQPTHMLTIWSCIGIEQFGYGVGFAGCLLYMLYVAGSGRWQTVHYAITTGIMVVGLMLPGMISGYLQQLMGYQHFFVWVCLCTLPSLYAIKKIPLDPMFGVKEKAIEAP